MEENSSSSRPALKIRELKENKSNIKIYIHITKDSFLSYSRSFFLVVVKSIKITPSSFLIINN